MSTLYRSLQRDGVTIRSSMDLLVGAWCIENDCTLIHSSRDFGPLQGKGLQVWDHNPHD